MSEVLVSTHDLPRAGALRSAFSDRGFAVDLVTPDEAIDESEGTLLVVLTGGIEGASIPPLLKQAREDLHVPVLAYAPLGNGREPEGITEVFAPTTRADEVALVGGRLAERTRLQAVTGIRGETDAMREVLERVVQIAPVSSTVLITGESGTGKELVARGLHALSPRRHRPFIAVNVAALTDTLLESELFGHEKGAFTGAIDSRKGLFELAHTGTIFLDEIGEMPLATQTKLLRVLEQREFLRVGGEKPLWVDVRIVAATNQDLRQLVAIRAFRKDLYYRLNVLHIELPPLRERRADIPLLIREFSEEVAERLDRPFSGISNEAMEILQAHSWPGNVRELRNLVESMVVMAPGQEIQPRDIPAEIRQGDTSPSRLLPAPIPRPDEGEVTSLSRPQLEFVFRTLIDMRVDLDDLRKEFDEYRDELPDPVAGHRFGLLGEKKGRGIDISPADRELGQRSVEVWVDGDSVEVENAAPVERSAMGLGDGDEAGAAGDGGVVGDVGDGGDGGDVSVVGTVGDVGDEGGAGAAGEAGDVVVYRPGMTMEDLEREAIGAALRAVDGNRRKAAELLEIGERTLYRKIKKFGLDS